jgi:MoxR-like ATPase
MNVSTSSITSSQNLTAFIELRRYLNTEILGQGKLVERLLVALLGDGHLLVEGPPGLAKTRAIKALAKGIEGNFQRIQFTPDMLPSDLTGSDIYRPESGSFSFQRGPLFHNLILADEINRAPAKVQSALLEAMAERQISVGNSTYPLPALFLVMATQNPIEHEGTYPLPEAQLDRFMLHTLVNYPDRAATKLIMALARREAVEAQELQTPPKLLSLDVITSARR